MKKNPAIGLKPLLLPIAFVLFGGFATPAHAAPGDLDLRFGGSGKVVTRPCSAAIPHWGWATVAKVQSDWKIVVAGQCNVADPSGSGGARVTLIRYNPNGSVDTSFGADGIVIGRIEEWGNESNDLTIQPDGKLLLLAYRSSGQPALVRFQPDGNLDSTFGSGGIVVVDVGLPIAPFTAHIPQGLLLDGSGRMVVLIRALEESTSRRLIVLARFKPDGGLDPSFGTAGRVVVGSLGTGSNTPIAMARQDDGKIVVEGLVRPAVGALADYRMFVARFLEDGALDPGFGPSGTGYHVFDSLPVMDDGTGDIVVQPDGRIVVLAIHLDSDFILLRLMTDGNLDPGFGIGGVTRFTFGIPGGVAWSLLLSPMGHFYVGGYAGSDFALAKLKSNGFLDEGFGRRGTVLTDIHASSDDGIYALAFYPGDRIIGAGFTTLQRDETGEETRAFALARYLVGEPPPATLRGIKPFARWWNRWSDPFRKLLHPLPVP